jgi:hypothetical protein
MFYLGFAAVPLIMMLGWDSSGSSDQAAHDWTAWVLAKPFGQLIVGVIGVAIAAVGVGIGIKGSAARARSGAFLPGRGISSANKA